MNRKVKDLKKKPLAPGARGGDAGPDELERPRFKAAKPRSSFKSKTPSFTPRVRQLDDDFDAATESGEPRWKTPEREPEPEPPRPPVGKPFLRIVSNNGNIAAIDPRLLSSRF